MLTMEVIICICTIWFSISEVSMVSSMPWLVSWVIIRVMKSVMSRSRLLPFLAMVTSLPPAV